MFYVGILFNSIAMLLKTYCVQNSLYKLVGKRDINYLIDSLILELSAVYLKYGGIIQINPS